MLVQPSGGWLVGSFRFEFSVDSDRQDSFTAKFRSGEFGLDKLGQLCFFCEGQQFGWRHLGSVDPLDIAASEEPIAPGCFRYTTEPFLDVAKTIAQ